jgi:hypothetical protein
MNMTRPIYAIEAEVPGHLGEDALYSGDTSGWNVTKMHLEFDGWMGDDIIQVLNCFLVTDKAKRLLEVAKLKGLSFERPIITKSADFLERQPDTTLPEFWWIRPPSSLGDGDVAIEGNGFLVVSETAMKEIHNLNLSHASVRPRK